MSRIKPAGWLALSVLGVVLVGIIGLGVRQVLSQGSLQPAPAPEPTATSLPTATPSPAPDPELAWTTFLDVVYKCDALPDVGDDLEQYPQTYEELAEDVEKLTTDASWLAECERTLPCEMPACWGRRLATFGPRNLECDVDTCEAAVLVESQAGLIYGYGDQPVIMRPPGFTDRTPTRLIRGTLEYQEKQWIVTQVEVDVLPELPATSNASP